MKLKKYLPLILIIVIQLIASSLLFRPGFYLTHDGINQLARIGAYYKAFSELNFPPRWAGDLNFGFGTPVFIFFYPLPGYIGSLFHALGFSLENSFKLLAGLSFVLAPVTFYFWMKKKASDEKVRMAASLMYGLAPYHFLDLYVRGDLGEMLALAFIPLVFLFLDEIADTVSFKRVLIGGMAYALVVLSHNGLALIFSPIFLLYGLLLSFNKSKPIYLITLMFITGLSLSAFFWLPAIYEARFTNFYFFNNDLYKSNFPTFTQLIYSKWGYGPDVNLKGGLSPQVGLLEILFVFIAIFFYLFEKKRNRMLLFWLIIFFTTLFLSVKISLPIWELIRPLRQLEFPWRLTALLSFAAAVLTGHILSKTNNRWVNLITICLVIIIIGTYIGTDKQITFPDKYYSTFAGTTTYHNEVATIWAGSDAFEYPKKAVQIIAGYGFINDYRKRNASHTFAVDSETVTKILDSTLYFPGWRVKIDSRNVPVEFQDPNHKGLLTFEVPRGIHRVEVSFYETPVRLTSDLISLVTVLLVLILLFKPTVISILWKRKH